MPMGARRRDSRGYTLVEVLIVVVILGICASMVAPVTGGAAALRTQAAVRTIVADITEAQADSLAFQEGRAIRFDARENSYRIIEVTGSELDDVADLIRETVINGTEFGDTRISDASFDEDEVLVFDEMGSPVTEPAGSTPAANGTLRVTGGGASYLITVEAFTGRVTVTRE